MEKSPIVRWMILFAGLGLGGTVVLAQTFSDMFDGRQLLTGTSALITGSNSNATVEPFEPLPAGQVGGHSVWISWRAPGDGLLSLSTTGSTFDTLLGIYTLRSGDGPALQRLRDVSADDDDEEHRILTSYVSVGVNSNQTYQIAVDGFNGATGDISLQLGFLSSTNLQPTVLRRSGDRSQRLGDPLILTIGIRRVKDLDIEWYLNGHRITEDSASPTLVIPSLQATNLGFYSVRLKLNDDSFFSPPIEIQANSEGLSGVLARYKMPDAARSGLVRKAKGVTGVTLGYNGTQIFNTTNSIFDPNAPTICGATGGAPYWFLYQAPTNGTMTVNTSGSSFDTLLAVFTYNGTLDAYSNLFSIACDTTNGPNGQPSAVQFQTETGRNYFIVVDGVNGARGIAQLNYSLVPDPASELPVITSQPQPLAVSRRTPVALSVVADGAAPFAYQWLMNGAPLNQETNPSLFFPNPQSQDNGAYAVVVTNVAGAVTSAPARVEVVSRPVTTVNTASNWMICGFPGIRGYQYSVDASVGGLGAWQPLTNVFPDYGGMIWLTNSLERGSAFFLRVHSP